MNLREYLDKQQPGARAELAGGLGISTVYLSQIIVRQGNREPSPELSVRIEQATGKKVTRRDLRPKDWWQIWPELIDAAHPAPTRKRSKRATPTAQPTGAAQ